MDKCNVILKKTLKLSQELRDLALEGERLGFDIQLITLCSVIHDISAKISLLAKKEIHNHKMTGKWI